MALGLLIGAYLLIGVIVVMYERCLRIANPTPTTIAPQEPLGFFSAPETSGTTEPDAQQFKTMFLNEDEEDIKHMLDTGKITKEQVPDVLDALGIANEINFN